jgi:two-component system LytT family response regulator
MNGSEQSKRLAYFMSARIAIKTPNKIRLIDLAEILVARSEGNYVLLQRAIDSYLVRGKISILASQLQPYGFLRVHRSTLANIAYIEAIDPLPSGDYLLRMTGGRTYRAARTYRENLRQLADLWIGFDL